MPSTLNFLKKNSFLFFICISFSLNGQNEQFSPELLMPNPTAASLGKYIESPVDQSTGIPDITIPLYEVKDGNLSLPISLKYHLGGLKVAETASDIGMGWSLHAGGMISRTVQGFPDEMPNGYIENFDVIQNGNVDFDADLYITGYVDFEPDIFTFSAGGYSGKFFYTNKGWATVTSQNLKIESLVDDSLSPDPMISSFKITTPDGLIYYFGKYDFANGLEIANPIERVDYNTFYNSSSWYLVRIESSDGYNQIDFEYTDYRYEIKSRNYASYFKNNYSVNGSGGWLGCVSALNQAGGVGPWNRETTKYYDGKKLYRITSSCDVIKFERDESIVREDIYATSQGDEPGIRTSPSHPLDYIEINNGAFCKMYDLEHSYFVDPAVPNEYSGKRLKLTSMFEASCSNNFIRNPRYIFKYVGDPSLPGPSVASTFAPHKYSKRIDHWGFFNNAAVNDSQDVLAPNTKIGDSTYGSAIRETNEQVVSVASLQKIIYPTGGYTSYEVESNEVWDTEKNRSRSVGGLRIKRIEHVDPLNQKKMVREYKYNKPASNKSSGKLFIEPKYGYKFNMIEELDSGATVSVEQERIESSAIVPLSDFSGMHIRYENVEEQFINEGGTERSIEGSIEYNNCIINAPEYFSQDDFYPKVPIIPDPKHGRLKKQSTKNNSGDELTSFSNDDDRTDVHQTHSAFSSKFHIVNVPCGSDFIWLASETTYLLTSSLNRVTRTTSVTDGVVTVTDYDYSGFSIDLSLPHSPIAVTRKNSDGKTHRKEFTYARTSGFGLSHPDSDPCLVESNMLEVPIAERNYVNGAIQGGWRVDYTSSNNGHCKPSTFYEIIVDDNGNSLEYVRNSILEYDQNGNPFRVKKRGFAEETLSWNDNHLLEQRDWNKWTWKWDYYDGSRMLEKYTDIDDQNIIYSYDDFMRLELISERDGFIQRDFTYDYKIDNNSLNSILTEISYDEINMSTTQYLDGLGRPVQSVRCGYSSDEKDVYESVEYDDLGRPFKNYQTTEGGSRCEYYPLGEEDFWETTYEASPLNRPIFNILSSWPSGTSTFYGCNSGSDQVRIYEAECGNQHSGIYASCSLTKVTNVDENGNCTETFTDKIGRQILIRKFLSMNYFSPFVEPVDDETAINIDDSTNAGDLRVDTYFVYDDIGNLTSVISPEGVRGNTGDVNYCYEYDELNRLVKKDLPGADAMTMGYYENDLLKWEADAKGNTINYVYDEYGRLTKKYLGGSFDSENNVEGGKVILEDIYFQENSTNSFKSQLQSSSIATVIGENIIGPLLTTNFIEYDNYTRLKKSASTNNVGGSDLYEYEYNDHADNVKGISRIHSSVYPGYEQLTTEEFFTYDHSLRQKEHSFYTGLTKSTKVLSFNEYTYRDELDKKMLGEIEPMDYEYNSRSWLTSINSFGNSLPFDENLGCVPDLPVTIDLLIEPFNPCDPTELLPMTTSSRYSQSTVTCTFVDCDSLPECHSNEIGYGDATSDINSFKGFISGLDADDMGYPQNLYRVRLCDGQELYITDSELLIAQINGIAIPSYIVLQVIPIHHVNQSILIEDANGDVSIIPFYKLIDLLNSGKLPIVESYPVCGENKRCNKSSIDYPIKTVRIADQHDQICDITIDFKEGVNSTEGFCTGDLNSDYPECYSRYPQFCYNFEPVDCNDMKIDSTVFLLSVSINACPYGYINNDNPKYSIVLDGVRYNDPERMVVHKDINIDDLCIYISIEEDYLNSSVDTILTCVDHLCIHDIQRITYYSCDCSTEDPPKNPDDCTCTPLPPIQEDPCVDDLPDCTFDELLAQEAYIEELELWAENVNSSDVSFPIEVCKTTLCDGRSISIPYQYIIDHPLPGPHDCEITFSPQEPPDNECPKRNSKFAMKFSYHSPDASYSGAVPQYNGNISQVEQQINKKHIEGINYEYDELDRLLKQEYWWKSCKNQYWNNKFFNVGDITYDLNGNMRSIKRNTIPNNLCDLRPAVIDNLNMSYSGNQLTAVSEASTLVPEMGYIKGNHDGIYEYDVNGNMTKIGNNNISLGYNFLNLPGGKGNDSEAGETTPAWTYTANGAKLKYENKDYVDGIEYRDGKLYCIHHAEGRIFPEKQTDAQIANNFPIQWEHNFYLRDHLGNTRIVIDEAGIPIQENNYYPFGMNIENIDAIPDDEDRDSRYTYNGKEMNEDLDWLDYGFRFYDPSICRFTGVDPIAADFAHVSSYNYAENDPIKNIDLWGLQGIRADMAFADPGLNAVNATPQERRDFQKNMGNGFAAGVVTAAAVYGGAKGVAYLQGLGVSGTAALIGNEIKDEVLSQATGGLSDFADVTKMAGKGLKNLFDLNVDNFDDVVNTVKDINKNFSDGSSKDIGGIESAINSASFHGTPGEQAAALFNSMAGGHVFSNGNKRTASEFITQFASDNGLTLKLNSDQIKDLTSQLANGNKIEISELSKQLFGN